MLALPLVTCTTLRNGQPELAKLGACRLVIEQGPSGGDQGKPGPMWWHQQARGTLIISQAIKCGQWKTVPEVPWRSHVRGLGSGMTEESPCETGIQTSASTYLSATTGMVDEVRSMEYCLDMSLGLFCLT
jgi:hypothetical protein